MADVAQRTEGVPSLTARAHWRNYALGMLTEALYVLGLTAVAVVLAVLATVIW